MGEESVSYSSIFSGNITMQISSIDESINRDLAKSNHTNSGRESLRDNIQIPSPGINILNKCNNMMDDNGNITINSYCYCDCESAYVLITDIVENGYKVIDLFEQRERMSFSNKLTLINDMKAMKIAKKQYKEYLINNLKDSLDA